MRGSRGRRRNQKASDDNGFADGGGYMAVKKAKLEEQFNKVSNVFGNLYKIYQKVKLFFRM